MQTKFKNIKLFFAIMLTTITVWCVADYAVFGLKEMGVEVGEMTGFGTEVMAAEYYVAPNGIAAWTECVAIELPCSQATANSSARDGDLVYYLSGIYTETILFLAHGVTAQSYEKHGAVINNSELDYGLYSNTNGVTFDGFTVYVPNGNNLGIKTNPDAEDCKIINNRIIGVNDSVYTYGIRAENGGAGMIVSGNEITAVSQGIGFSSVSGFSGLCRDNYIHSFSSYGSGGSSDGIKFSGGGDFTEFVVEHNEITGWHQDAIDLFGGNNVMVRYNYIYHCSGLNAGNGIKAGGASGGSNTIYGNYLVESGDRETGYGIASNSGDNLVIAYNIVIGFAYGITIFSGDDNPIIVNNYTQSPNRGIVISDVNNVTLLNNIMDGKNYDLKWNNTNIATTNKNIHVNFSSSHDSLYVRYDNIDGDMFQTDPLFINPLSNDFHLQPASPAIDAGINVGLTEDYDGVSVPQGSAPDIGAYEYIPSDTTPPILSNPSPSETLSSGTTQTTISLTTNESATCKYSTTPNIIYNSIPNTFSTTGGTAHSQTITGLSDGNAYNYYVRCLDGAGNPNTADYAITFSVEAAVSDSIPPTGSISINNGDATTNSQNTNLSISASDSSSVTEMKISNTNDFSSAIAETYSTVKSWALSAGDGLKTVYAWFKDTIGNWNTTPYSDTISLDTSGDGGGDDGGGGGGTVSDTTPPTISNITILNITTASVQINFNTNELTTSYIEYGLTASYGMRTETNPTPISNIQYLISNLSNNTTYHYRITSTDEAGNASRSTDQTFIMGEPTIPNPSLPHPNGSLLTSIDDEKIYFIVNNQRKWITSIEVFLSYGLTPNTEIIVDQSVLEQYPLGEDINVSSLKEGTLIRGKNTFQVYIIKPPYKRHIFNPAVFNMYQHFDWNSIEEIEADIVNSYITSDIYRSLNDHRIYSLEEIDEVLGKAIKHHLNMTSERFTEKGYNWNQVFIVNEEERDYYETGGDLE